MPRASKTAPSLRTRPHCGHCRREFVNHGAVARHVRQAKDCRDAKRAQQRALIQRLSRRSPCRSESDPDDGDSAEGDLLDRVYGSPVHDASWDIAMDNNFLDSPIRTPSSVSIPEVDLRATVVDVPDDDDIQVTDEYPGAAQPHVQCRTPPIECDFAEAVSSSTPWGPFPSAADLDLTEWAKTESISDAALSRLLRIQSLHTGVAAKSARDVNGYADALPSTATFKHQEISLDSQDGLFDLFYRNPLDVIRDLIGDPTFAGQLLWKPVRHYTDSKHQRRQYTESNSGDWMWETQVKLPDGATVLSVILSSDKTELTSFTGKQSCYPVYLTLGNIPKHLRRQSSARAQRLIAYLPTGKVDGTTVSTVVARKLRARLFHECMSIVCQPLFAPAKDGVDLTDSEGFVRTCYPILAAYAADYPEQCLVTCVRYGQACPVCDVLLEGFDTDTAGEIRQQRDTLHTIHTANQYSAAEKAARLTAAGLNDIPHPFWEGWAHANIHAAMSSDVLHQLIQGVGKHLVEWLIELAPEKELNARIQRLPNASGLRHFKDGITKLANVSGTEHKAIYAQLMGCIQGIVPDDAVRAACAALDFIYVAQFECHSDETLDTLSTALSTFHELKDVFIRHGVRADFKLPKLHACQHYVQSIRRFGTVDNYNTEATERLHIDLAKHAFRATNKREYVRQMCRWLSRRESIFWFRTYRAWKRNEIVPARIRDPRPKNSSPVILAKRPHRRNVALKDLTRLQGVHDFRSSLEDFVRQWRKLPQWRGYAAVLPSLATYALDNLSHVSVWNHVKFITPNTETIASADTKNTAYASTQRARFDTVLVKVRGEDIAGAGGLDGIRVGRLRAIFTVPQRYEEDLFGKDTPEHLAFVDWYSELPAREDAINGMFPLQNAYTADGRRDCAVVDVLSLRRGCHLFPKFGTDPVNRKLRSNIILDAYGQFYLNNRVDKDAYRSMVWDDDDDESGDASGTDNEAELDEDEG